MTLIRFLDRENEQKGFAYLLHGTSPFATLRVQAGMICDVEPFVLSDFQERHIAYHQVLDEELDHEQLRKIRDMRRLRQRFSDRILPPVGYISIQARVRKEQVDAALRILDHYQPVALTKQSTALLTVTKITKPVSYEDLDQRVALSAQIKRKDLASLVQEFRDASISGYGLAITDPDRLS